MIDLKDLFKGLLLERWGTKKSTPNLKRVKVKHPFNAERDYSAFLENALTTIEAPLHRRLSQRKWNAYIGVFKSVHDSSEAVQDSMGAVHDFEQINLEMLARQEAIMLPNPKRAKKGALAAIISFGDMVDEIAEQNTNEMLQFTIGRAFDMRTPFIKQVVNEWSNANFERIKSLTSEHIGKVNEMLREGVAYGESWESLSIKIQKLTGLAKNRAKLIAVDQVCKLNGAWTKARQEQLGLNMYRWRTVLDNRVRPTHRLMEGKLCKWDDSSVISLDDGLTWQPKPAGAPLVHVGVEIRCRCSGEAYMDDIIAEGKAAIERGEVW